ncbi:MAG: arginase family protein [Candidatus Margulisiibacteriota bacterium]
MTERIGNGERTLRQNRVVLRVQPSRLPLHPGLTIKEAARRLFGANPPIRAGSLLLDCGFETGRLDALKLSRSIRESEPLNRQFLARAGAPHRTVDLLKTVISRLGDASLFFPVEGSQPAAAALECLRQGDVEAFNALRRENPSLIFDFSGQDFSNVDLKNGDCTSVNLDGIFPLSPVARKNLFGFVVINSGYGAGKRIDPDLDSADMIFQAWKTEVVEYWHQAWLAIRGRTVSTRPVILTPQGLQAFKPGEFKYMDHHADNYRRIINKVIGMLDDDFMPVVIGGDHSITYATQGAINDYYYKMTGQPIGLIWVDAHGDINQEDTTPSGNFHGAPVAGLLGKLKDPRVKDLFEHHLRPENVVYIAARDLDEGEVKTIEQLGIKVFGLCEIKEKGMKRVAEEAYQIATRDTAGVSVSFDIDGFDKMFVPGTGTPVEKGLTLDMGRDLCQAFSTWERLVSFELVEINPANDRDRLTLNLGVKVLMASLLGIDTFGLPPAPILGTRVDLPPREQFGRSNPRAVLEDINRETLQALRQKGGRRFRPDGTSTAIDLKEVYVKREKTVKQIQERVAQALGSGETSGRVLFVTGEAGSGKSCLIHELAEAYEDHPEIFPVFVDAKSPHFSKKYHLDLLLGNIVPLTNAERKRAVLFLDQADFIAVSEKFVGSREDNLATYVRWLAERGVVVVLFTRTEELNNFKGVFDIGDPIKHENLSLDEVPIILRKYLQANEEISEPSARIKAEKLTSQKELRALMTNPLFVRLLAETGKSPDYSSETWVNMARALDCYFEMAIGRKSGRGGLSNISNADIARLREKAIFGAIDHMLEKGEMFIMEGDLEDVLRHSLAEELGELAKIGPLPEGILSIIQEDLVSSGVIFRGETHEGAHLSFSHDNIYLLLALKYLQKIKTGKRFLDLLGSAVWTYLGSTKNDINLRLFEMIFALSADETLKRKIFDYLGTNKDQIATAAENVEGRPISPNPFLSSIYGYILGRFVEIYFRTGGSEWPVHESATFTPNNIGRAVRTFIKAGKLESARWAAEKSLEIFHPGVPSIDHLFKEETIAEGSNLLVNYLEILILRNDLEAQLRLMLILGKSKKYLFMLPIIMQLETVMVEHGMGYQFEGAINNAMALLETTPAENLERLITSGALQAASFVNILKRRAVVSNEKVIEVARRFLSVKCLNDENKFGIAFLLVDLYLSLGDRAAAEKAFSAMEDLIEKLALAKRGDIKLIRFNLNYLDAQLRLAREKYRSGKASGDEMEVTTKRIRIIIENQRNRIDKQRQLLLSGIYIFHPLSYMFDPVLFAIEKSDELDESRRLLSEYEAKLDQ